VARKRLTALGFTEPLSELDCITADILLFIDIEYAALMADEAKKFSKRKS